MTPQTERAQRFLKNLDALGPEQRLEFAVLLIQWREAGTVTPARGMKTVALSLREALDQVTG